MLWAGFKIFGDRIESRAGLLKFFFWGKFCVVLEFVELIVCLVIVDSFFLI